MEKKTIYLICLGVYFLIVFLTELAYREPLYNSSLESIKEIEQGGFLEYFYVFWGLIIFYGIIFLGLAITIIYYPLNVFLSYLMYEIVLIFVMCILKSMYASPRPYWDILKENYQNQKEMFKPTSCEPEFGNPSGHALQSTFILCLWHLFTHSKLFNKWSDTKKTVVKYATLAFSIVTMILIMYSRVHRQVHAMNQIIFGFLLSIGIWFAFCYIMELNTMTLYDFFNYVDSYKLIVFPIFCALFVLSVNLGMFVHNENEKIYAEVLSLGQTCNIFKDRIFGKNTAFHSTIIFIFMGGYLGLIFLRYKIKKNHPNDEKRFYEWNQQGILVIIKMLLLSFSLPGVFSLIIIFVPYTYYAAKFILGIFCYLLYGFSALGFCYYYACQCCLGCAKNVGENENENNQENNIVNNQENNEEVKINSPIIAGDNQQNNIQGENAQNLEDKNTENLIGGIINDDE